MTRRDDDNQPPEPEGGKAARLRQFLEARAWHQAKTPKTQGRRGRTPGTARTPAALNPEPDRNRHLAKSGTTTAAAGWIHAVLRTQIPRKREAGR
jgi:hypothetical protein